MCWTTCSASNWRRRLSQFATEQGHKTRGQQQIRNTCNQGLWLRAVKAGHTGAMQSVRGCKCFGNSLPHHKQMPEQWPYIWIDASPLQPHRRSPQASHKYRFPPGHCFGFHYMAQVFMISCPPPAHQGWTRYHKLQKNRCQIGSLVCRGCLADASLEPSATKHVISALLLGACPWIAATSRIHIVCLWGRDGDEIPHPD